MNRDTELAMLAGASYESSRSRINRIPVPSAMTESTAQNIRSPAPTLRRALSHLRVALAASLLILAGSACSEKSVPQNTFEWKEEILLHDGRKIIAERVDVMGGWAEPGQSGAPQERRITFPDPDNPSKTYTHRITGSSNYLLLDFDKGVPWLIVFVGPFSNDTRCPIGTYETFGWIDSRWRSVSYSLLPEAIAKPNMAVSYVVDSTYAGIQPGEQRRLGHLLSAASIARMNEAAQRSYSPAATWRLVQTMDEGNPLDEKRPIDCEYYKQQPGKSERTN